MKRNISILLLIAMLLVTACSGKQTESSEDTEGQSNAPAQTDMETETETELHDNVPDGVKFDGATFALLSADEYGGQCLTEEQTGDALNDAVYAMRISVEERLGVQITEELTKFWEMQGHVEKLITSGDTSYSAVEMMDRFGFPLVQKHCFLPISDVPYIDLSRAYWGSGLSADLQINGENYFAVGSFNLKAFTNTACTLINRTLGEHYGVSVAEEVIDSGAWTYDMLYSLAEGITTDANGDGTMDANDIYGLGHCDLRSAPATAWIASGFHTLDKGTDGKLAVNVYGNERFVDILTMVQDKLFFGDACYKVEDSASTWSTMDIFKDGRQWAMIGVFNAIVEMRDMEDDFTVVPVPKFEESAAEYRSRTYDSYFTLIPTTVQDTEMVGAVLEAMSYASYQDVIPAYIQTTLKGKASRDEMAAKYIQLAFDTRHIDLGEALIFDVFGDQSMFDMLKKQPLGIASYLEKKQKTIDKAFSEIVALTEDGAE